MTKGIIILDGHTHSAYSPHELRQISELVDVYAPIQTRQTIENNLQVLFDAEVVITSWGSVRFDKKILEAAGNLKAVFYAAGSIRGIVTEEFWNRGILITSAAYANAIPVAQYIISQIFACLKNVWRCSNEIKRFRAFPRREAFVHPSGYEAVIGLISLGQVGVRVCEYLQAVSDFKIIAYDPYRSIEDASMLGVELCSLEELFRNSDVVSAQTPYLDTTRGMIKGKHFEMMKPNASFINTARGGIVQENEMIEVLKARTDLTAVLDVTNPEPPHTDSALFDLDNVILTPHIAGSIGPEIKRLGKYMVDELRRYVTGKDLKWAITQERLEITA